MTHDAEHLRQDDAGPLLGRMNAPNATAWLAALCEGEFGFRLLASWSGQGEVV